MKDDFYIEPYLLDYIHGINRDRAHTYKETRCNTSIKHVAIPTTDLTTNFGIDFNSKIAEVTHKLHEELEECIITATKEGYDYLLYKYETQLEPDNSYAIKYSLITVPLTESDLTIMEHSDFHIIALKLKEDPGVMIKCPAIYKHAKGNTIATVCISKPIEIADVPEDWLSNRYNKMFTDYTEDRREIMVIRIDNKFYHPNTSEIVDKELVVYKNIYDNHVAYSTPLKSFIGDYELVK